jgi:hypothetical protein
MHYPLLSGIEGGYTIFETLEYRIVSLRGDPDFVGDDETISR